MFELFDPDADVRIEKGANLPHWYQPEVSYFVTFRTKDSMPVEVSRRWHAQRADWLQRHGISMGNRNWREQLDRLDVALRREFHETFSRQYLEALDKGYGACPASKGTQSDRGHPAQYNFSLTPSLATHQITWLADSATTMQT